jgi:hypothetical protein
MTYLVERANKPMHLAGLDEDRNLTNSTWCSAISKEKGSSILLNSVVFILL